MALVVLLAGAAMWAFYLVVAIMKGAYGLGALNGVLLAGSVWAITRILSRRRRRGDSSIPDTGETRRGA